MSDILPLTAEEETTIRVAGAGWCGETTFARIWATLDAARAEHQEQRGLVIALRKELDEKSEMNQTAVDLAKELAADNTSLRAALAECWPHVDTSFPTYPELRKRIDKLLGGPKS